jgi:hypothetical protein
MKSFKSGKEGSKAADPSAVKPHEAVSSEGTAESISEEKELASIQTSQVDEGSRPAGPEPAMSFYSPVTQMETDHAETETVENSDEVWDLIQEIQGREEERAAQASEQPVDEAVIDRAVGEINEIAKRSVDTGALEIGEMVLGDILKWDLKEALCKDPFKNKSFARLSQHPKLNVDARRISEWVKAAALKKELVAEGVETPNLGLHHLMCLGKVKDPTLRGGLALEASEGRYSVRKTREEVNKVNGQESSEDLMKNIIRQLQDPRILLRDTDMREMLEDQEKIKSFLDSDQRLSILTAVEKSKKDAKEVQIVLTKIGNAIFQVEQDERAASAL